MSFKYHFLILLLLILQIFCIQPLIAAEKAMPKATVVKATETVAPKAELRNDAAQNSEQNKVFIGKDNNFDKSDWVNQPDSGKDKEFDRSIRKRLGLTVVSLIFISFLIYIVLKFISSGKFNIPALGLAPPSNLIHVVDRQAIAPNKALYVVKVGDKHILLGLSENRITYLTDVNVSIPKSEKKISSADEKEEKENIANPFDFFSQNKKN